MFDKFGNFDSYEELNRAAAGLKDEGDEESLKALARENGIDIEDVQGYLSDDIPELVTAQTAALGKLEIESNDLSLPKNILISDWVSQIKTYAMEDEAIALAVHKKDKSLVGCLAAILKEAFKNQWQVPEDIVKAAGTSANRVTFGIPSAAGTNAIIKDYYLGVKNAKE